MANRIDRGPDLDCWSEIHAIKKEALTPMKNKPRLIRQGLLRIARLQTAVVSLLRKPNISDMTAMAGSIWKTYSNSIRLLRWNAGTYRLMATSYD
jgi:hypothetical protein